MRKGGVFYSGTQNQWLQFVIQKKKKTLTEAFFKRV